jgi:uncharacterized membrane protein
MSATASPVDAVSTTASPVSATTIEASTIEAPPLAGRIMALDIVRGLVMVLMAIDHVRVYSGLPAGGPTPGIFFTRWVTHFCAPAFVFLAGTGAFLHGRKLGNKDALARYLVTRGLFLVLLELTVIRFAWTFNFDYAHFTLAGVIWMLGWCMVLLAGLVWLPTWAVGAIGFAVILLQRLFALPPLALPESIRNSTGWIWEFIYPAGLHPPKGIIILYVLVPWIGVMAVGYAFGAVMIREEAERRGLLMRIGLSMIVLFLAAGVLALFMFPAADDARPALFRLLDQQKYPPSLLFLLMTIGPTIVLLALAEHAQGLVARVLRTFGRVPLFYYLMHIPLIHVTALAVMRLREASIPSEWCAHAPYVWMPEEHRWGLALLYLVFILDVAVLYFSCRWFAGVKARHPKGWLSYL